MFCGVPALVEKAPIPRQLLRERVDRKERPFGGTVLGRSNSGFATDLDGALAPRFQQGQDVGRIYEAALFAAFGEILVS